MSDCPFLPLSALLDLSAADLRVEEAQARELHSVVRRWRPSPLNRQVQRGEYLAQIERHQANVRLALAVREACELAPRSASR